LPLASIAAPSKRVLPLITTPTPYHYLSPPPSTLPPPGDHKVFDYTKSSTYSPVLEVDNTNKGFEVDYGSGRVVGFQGIETLTIGGLKIHNVSMGLGMYEDEEIR